MPMFGESFYKSIELAIQTTGTAGVAELVKAVQDAETQIANFQAALAAGGAVDAKAIQDLTELRAAVERYKEMLAAAQRVMAGQPAMMKDSAEQTRAAARAMLEFSRAAEDFATGGFLGILNNVPGIVRNIGQSLDLSATKVVAIETAFSLLATTLYSIYRNWDQIVGFFGQGLPLKFTNDIEAVTKQLKTLQDKPVKVAIDYDDITDAKRHLDSLQAAESAYNRLKSKKSEVQQEQAKRATDAIVEHGGGDDHQSSIDKLAAVAASLTQVQDSVATQKLRQQKADAEKLSNSADPDIALKYSGKIDEIQAKIEAQRVEDKRLHGEEVRRRVSMAGDGRAPDVEWLLSLYRQNSNAFTSRGIDEGFGQALGRATRPNVERDRAEKEQKKTDDAEWKRQEKEINQADAEQRKAVATAVKSVQGGVDDKLEDDLVKTLKGGTSREAAVNEAIKTLLPVLEQRNVPLWVRQAVAEQLASTAADKAENVIQEDGKSKLQTKAEQAQRKTEAAQKAADSKHDALINRLTTGANAGFHDEQTVLAYEDLQRGRTRDQVIAARTPNVAGGLKNRGDVPADAVDEVAAAITRKAVQEAQNDIDSGQLPKRMKAADAKREQAARKLAPGFLAGAEAMFAANDVAIQRGLPTANTQRQIQHFEGFGQPYALSPAMMQQYVESEVAKRLHGAGQDSGMAHDVVAESISKYRDDVTKGVGQTGNLVATLIGIMREGQQSQAQANATIANLVNRVDSLQKNSANLQQGAKRTSDQLRRNTIQRPSLLQDFAFPFALAGGMVSSGPIPAELSPLPAIAVQAASTPNAELTAIRAAIIRLQNEVVKLRGNAKNVNTNFIRLNQDAQQAAIRQRASIATRPSLLINPPSL